MGCNAPLEGWRSRERTVLGKRAVRFSLSDAYSDMPIELRCGKCRGCMLDKAREWAIRCTHEAQMWDKNCFVTLTYDDEHLPIVDGKATLRKRDFVLFMKKLRNARNESIRFFQAGEYGKLGRPHHHALLFNCDFDDRVACGSGSVSPLFSSEELKKLWSFGFSSIGEVNFESAGYVARYTLKKAIRSDDQSRVKEYLTMSRNGGIGSKFFDKFANDMYPFDEVITTGGKISRPPRFYDMKMEKLNPDLMKRLKINRVNSVNHDERRGLRYMAKEGILKRKISDKLRRELQ